MGFADTYLKKQENFIPSIKEKPDKGINLIVVIPCYNEPGLVRSLDSVWNCTRPISAVEVIVVINSSVTDPKEVKDQNLFTLKQLEEWEKTHRSETFRYYAVFRDCLPAKYAGAGLARKTGMDEAVYRYNLRDNPQGVIISFDADATCEPNYLVEIEKTFHRFPKVNGCTIYFEHPVQGDQFSQDVYRGITQYELYLRYYFQGLKHAGFPFVFHTVGSCFSVRATGYVKAGGMNRKKAGEDFYFLQKLFPLGNIREINTTKVFPSPRPSNRVPFGTGPFIHKFLEDPTIEYMTYNFRAFELLRSFIFQTGRFYKTKEKDIVNILVSFPGSLQEFLNNVGFVARMDEINRNTATYQAFEKRFFQWFNAFMALKFMNSVHEKYLHKIPVSMAAGDLLKAINWKGRIPGKADELLGIFRRMERGTREKELRSM